MTRTLACALLLAALFVIAGCGSSERTISSDTALRDLQNAGFTELHIFRFAQRNDHNGEIDMVDQRSVAMSFLPPVQLIDYASDKTANSFYGRGRYVYRWYRADVHAGHGLVPRDFVYSPKKAFSARICNVILWSYNVDNDPRLRGRLNRAAHSLRQSCGS